MDRHSNQNIQHRGRPVLPQDAAMANEYFESFLSQTTLKGILGVYRHMCDLLHLRPTVFPLFYPKLRSHLTSWRAKALWKKFDLRVGHKCYGKGKICPNTRVLIIGAGPCGLRTAIEAQLLGAKVVVVEKRDRLSRNNVLHLWPFVIEDLRALGAKKFFGKFCAGAIDHISIRQLQCILLKAALLLGVEIHTEISFEKLVEPNLEEKTGWKALVKPHDHPVSQFEFDVIIGADGKRNTLQGFKRKEFRGKLAIAITANFLNKKTEAEARVEEISGVAFIFNQKFFKDLYQETGIDLENIVYYKDDTHYFVMTAKKPSLIEKGVIKQDLSDTAKLLAPDNVDREALMNYAREAANFSTDYQMPDLQFAVNHYGQADVAMFDFTSMYAAENASRIIERHGFKLLSILVGDSLLEPFWPTGSGCARGFLSALDGAWAIRAWGSGAIPLEVVAERESIFRLLAQTTPENLNKDCKSYTVDPSTRYPNLNKNLLSPHQVISLYDSDNPLSIQEQTRIQSIAEVPKKRRRKDSHVDEDTLLNWVREQVREHPDLAVTDIYSSFKDGRVLCAIINHYRPDLLDYSAVKPENIIYNNQLAFDLLEKELGISPEMTGDEMARCDLPDFLTMAKYLTKIYDTFRCEIPHIKHPKLKSPISPEVLRLAKLRHLPQEAITKDKSSVCKTPFMFIFNQNTSPNKSEKALFKNQAKSFLDIKIKDTENLKERTSLMYSDLVEESESTDQLNKIKFKIPSAHSICSSTLKNRSFGEHLRGALEKKFKSVQKHRPHGVHKNGSFLTLSSTSSLISLADIVVQTTEKIDRDNIIINKLNYWPKIDYLEITPTMVKDNLNNTNKYQVLNNPPGYGPPKKINLTKGQGKFWDENKLMSSDKMAEGTVVLSHEQTYKRVRDWITKSDFDNNLQLGDKAEVSVMQDHNVETNLIDKLTDITSITKHIEQMNKPSTEKKREICNHPDGNQLAEHSVESISEFVQSLRNDTKPTGKSTVSPWTLYEGRTKVKIEPTPNFSAITEAEETELSEIKRNEVVNFHHSSHHSSQKQEPSRPNTNSMTSASRLSARHRRHAENTVSSRLPSIQSSDNRKPKKRRTLERIGASVEERQKRLEEISQNRVDRQNKRRQQRKMQTEQFIKSMQMLHANAIRDPSEPFEDYSIFLYRQTAPNFDDRVKDLEKKFTYIPDKENKQQAGYTKNEPDEDFAARIKDVEEKWSKLEPQEKKPKDLIRAIGKIETSDWNIKQIEKKIQENKMGVAISKNKEKVPKWSREEFAARQAKMESKHLERQDSTGGKFSEIDKGIKLLDQRLKEGSTRDLNQHKVASITEKLVTKSAEPAVKPIQKSNCKTAVVLPTKGSSEHCHFCAKRVYLTERLTAEGRFFHRGCFRCQYCHTLLRMGSFLFDRDGRYGYRFFCTQHYGMSGELPISKVKIKTLEKPSLSDLNIGKSNEKLLLGGVLGLDLLDRVQTPERIEFSNLSSGHISSDHEDSPDPIDEDEWTDRNFGASTAEHGSTDEEDSSSASDTDSDDEDNYLEALEEPPTKEGTLLWAERFNRRYSRKRDEESDSDEYSSSDSSSYYENSSEDEESDTATEGEEEIRARELRKQEVRVEPPIVHTDTGTSTEIPSDETSSESSSEIQNSATEISTDSEFAQDEPTPTREFNDFHVTKTRGNGGFNGPKKVQVKSSVLQKPSNGRKKADKDIELKIAPLVPSSPIIRKPAPNSLLLRNEGYALNRTQSTGGIATKVSLELKKKYLLGESVAPGNIQKSGSASTLDSKLKSFHTNISDCQKLLKPAPEISASMKTFCSKLDERTSPLSPTYLSQSPTFFGNKSNNKTEEEQSIPKQTSTQPDLTKSTVAPQQIVETEPVIFEHENEGRPRSPVHETSIIVPTINWNEKKRNKKKSSSFDDSLTSTTDSEDDFKLPKSPSVKHFNNIPKLEIHDDTGEILHDANAEMALDSLNVYEIKSLPQPTSLNEPPKSIISDKKSLNQPKTLPKLESNKISPDLHTAKHAKVDEVIEVKAVVSENFENETKSVKNSSGRSTPSNNDSCIDQATMALTETELSDWARDGAASDDFEDVEFELNPDLENARNNISKSMKKDKVDMIRIADLKELDDLGHVCGKGKEMKEQKNKNHITECVNSILNPNLDNIEFMDTGTETSSDDNVFVEKNNGYMQFHNEDEIALDSLTPIINVIEATNPKIATKVNMEDFDDFSTSIKNTGYCIIGSDNNFGSEVIDLKPNDIARLKQKHYSNENEEDSLLIVETGTTTEENTCSDSTVKNVTEKISPLNEIEDQKQLIDKLEKFNEKSELKDVTNITDKFIKQEKVCEDFIKTENVKLENKQNMQNENNKEYEEHCHRLQSKVEFGNAKDSIDIRKSRRKSKTDIQPRPDLIQEEKEKTPVHSAKKDITLTLTSPKNLPNKINKREEIEKERNINQKLIQEMVMNKMKAENKSLERKKRNRNSFSPIRPFEITKSATTDIASQIKTNGLSNHTIICATPDVLLSTLNSNKKDSIIHKSQTVNSIADYNKNDVEITLSQKSPFKQRKQPRPLSVHSSFLSKTPEHTPKVSTPSIPESAFSLPDIREAFNKDGNFVTPKAPPRIKHEEAKRTAEKLKQDARARARLMSDEDLGLSPEDRINKLIQKVKRNNNPASAHVQDSIESLVLNTERRNSLLYSNDTLKKKKNDSFRRSMSGEDNLSRKLSVSKNSCDIKTQPTRTKSVSEIPNSYVSVKPQEDKKFDAGCAQQMCKSDPNLLNNCDKKEKRKTKDRERRKSITKFISDIFGKKKESPTNPNAKGLFGIISPKTKDKCKDKISEEPTRTKSYSELTIKREQANASPPPIPPLPLNYIGARPNKDDSSDGESEWKRNERSSCDTLDQSGVCEGSTTSLAGRKSGRARKAVKQAQYKRHRMAQEIQRKLEETDVKGKELELRGVSIEKALRGEGGSKENSRDETELLKEWFDLMRDITELRRYERELNVRAQELELEDRHARLQHELRERLENDEHKTEEDVEVEGSIIKEMMDIVAKRDSLIALLEEDRLRYSEEDRDFEEQMLAKGLVLTSLNDKPHSK